MPAKVFVFGVDAMEPKLILEWIESGDLPNLARLRSRAAWGTVLNPPRFFSGASWPNFYTGVGPARHGQYLRTLYDSSTCIHEPLRPDFDLIEPFWSRPEWRNKRTAVINVPYCPLDQNINGLQITGWRSHDRHLDRSVGIVPEHLAADFAKRFGYHDVANCEMLDFRTATLLGLLDRLISNLQQKIKLICEQLATEDWDLFVSAVDESHCAGHRFWHLHDRTHPRYDPQAAAVIGDAMHDVYIEIDRGFGKVLDRLSADSTVVFLSTHGMGPAFDGIPVLEEILRRLDGLPARAPDYSEQRVEQLERARAHFDRLPSVVQSALAPLRKRFGRRRLSDRLEDERRQRKYFWFPTHDLCGGIRINLVEREANGVVQPGAECERVIDQLKEDLFRLRDGRSGEAIVAEIAPFADMGLGGYTGAAPDLIVHWAKSSVAWIESPKVGRIDPIMTRGRTGDHDPIMHGIFFAAGPRVVPGPLREPVHLEDFAPTISEVLGIALVETDGREIAAVTESSSHTRAAGSADLRAE